MRIDADIPEIAARERALTEFKKPFFRLCVRPHLKLVNTKSTPTAARRVFPGGTEAGWTHGGV